MPKAIKALSAVLVAATLFAASAAPSLAGSSNNRNRSYKRVVVNCYVRNFRNVKINGPIKIQCKGQIDVED